MKLNTYILFIYRMKQLDSINDSTDMNLSQLQETVNDRGACCAAVRGHRVGYNLTTEQRKQPRHHHRDYLRLNEGENISSFHSKKQEINI